MMMLMMVCCRRFKLFRRWLQWKTAKWLTDSLDSRTTQTWKLLLTSWSDEAWNKPISYFTNSSSLLVILVYIFSSHHVHSVHRCGLYIPLYPALCKHRVVCLCVSGSRPWNLRNSWTDWDASLGEGWAKEPHITWGTYGRHLANTV